jgi:hypothetical protein
MSGGGLEVVGCDELVELAGDFFVGQALLGASLCVGAGIVAQSAEYDAVEGGVGLPVAAAVEPGAGGLPEEAGSGATPQRIAKAASEPIRGFDPAVTLFRRYPCGA